jgi:NAD dependent epimerase/dehydratase family enzyme
MSPKLGALGRLLPLVKLGVGGPLGPGNQWWAFISLRDEARAIIHLINNTDASGAFNLTAPESATCAQMVSALAKKLNRPAFLPVPSFALRLAFGEGADELLICNQQMTADRLLQSGFKFEHPTLESAVDYVLS